MFNLLKSNLDSTSHGLTTYLNPYSYTIARTRQDLFSNFNIRTDGILLVAFLRLFGFSHSVRRSFDMTSDAREVLAEAVESSQSVFLVGSTEENILLAKEQLLSEFYGLNIVGVSGGYIKGRVGEVNQQILKAAPDIIVCGMGTPLQEEFLLQLSDSGWQGRGYTCGGFFHQTTSSISYYPNWINRFNLRSIYRAWREPKLFQRYVTYYPLFVVCFLRDAMTHVFRNTKKR